MNFLNILKGKKTYIGCAILGLLSAMYFIDITIDDTASWLTEQQYAAAAVFISGLTGASLRQAITK